MDSDYVVVRSNGSGVWLGKLVSSDLANGVVVLKDAIRAWSWTGALSCSGLATDGPTAGKFPAAVSAVSITGVLEVIVATEKAVAAWKAVKPWQA